MTTTNSSLHDAPQISAKPAPGEKERCVLAYSGGLDTSVCIKWLQEEYDQMNCREKNIVPLGNGLVRVPLGALLPAQLEDLNRALVLSAACVRGSMLQFQQRAQAAVQLLKQGEWPIEAQTLERFLKTFDPRCQLISHSEIYRQTYHPAYRVILSELVPTIRTE